MAMLSIELEWLEDAEGGYRRALNPPKNGQGLLLAEGRVLPAMLLSFTCDICKVLKSFIDNGGQDATSFVVHAAPILSLPDDKNAAGVIRAGKQYNGLYLPATGGLPDSYVDFSLYQPLSIRTVLKHTLQRITGLTEPGRIYLAATYAQYLGDDSRRQATSSVPTDLERTYLNQAITVARI
jgi:hypothetical protein